MHWKVTGKPITSYAGEDLLKVWKPEMLLKNGTLDALLLYLSWLCVKEPTFPRGICLNEAKKENKILVFN